MQIHTQGSGVGKEKREPLTMEAIINEARKLLVEQGLETLCLRSLATRLGVTAPALYAHVENKRDLLRQISEDGYRRLVERLRERLSFVIITSLPTRRF